MPSSTYLAIGGPHRLGTTVPVRRSSRTRGRSLPRVPVSRSSRRRSSSTERSADWPGRALRTRPCAPKAPGRNTTPCGSPRRVSGGRAVGRPRGRGDHRPDRQSQPRRSRHRHVCVVRQAAGSEPAVRPRVHRRRSRGVAVAARDPCRAVTPSVGAGSGRCRDDDHRRARPALARVDRVRRADLPPLWGILAILPPVAGAFAVVLLRRRPAHQGIEG